MFDNMPLENKKTKQLLRQNISKARLDLPTHTKEDAAKKLGDIVINSPAFQQAQHIALYWPYNGEINSLPIINAALALNKHCYLPVLPTQKNTGLLFMPYNAKTTLRTNKYGIQEPADDNQQAIALAELAIIFLPLVAFDTHGYRLGMGGGHYDAILANVHKLPRSPLCIGLAFAMQELDVLPRDHWDIKLDSIVTEKGYRV